MLGHPPNRSLCKVHRTAAKLFPDAGDKYRRMRTMSRIIRKNIKKILNFNLCILRKLQRVHSKKFQLAGYTIFLDQFEGIQASISLGTYEPTETKWIYEILKPGMTFIDAGANIGYFSLIASSIVGNLGKVYSFEPSLYAYEKLCQTIKQNKINNIYLNNQGLGDHPEDLELSLWNRKLHSPSFCYSNGADSRHIKTINLGISKLITLDCFAEDNHIEFIDLIKVDVEGFEPNVIMGMTRLLQDNKVNRIMIEFNEYWLVQNNCTSDEMNTLICSFGFVLEKRFLYPDSAVGNYIYVNELASACHVGSPTDPVH
jgi:FkbM family methyltransferase